MRTGSAGGAGLCGRDLSFVRSLAHVTPEQTKRAPWQSANAIFVLTYTSSTLKYASASMNDTQHDTSHGKTRAVETLDVEGEAEREQRMRT